MSNYISADQVDLEFHTDCVYIIDAPNVVNQPVEQCGFGVLKVDVIDLLPDGMVNVELTGRVVNSGKRFAVPHYCCFVNPLAAISNGMDLFMDYMRHLVKEQVRMINRFTIWKVNGQVGVAMWKEKKNGESQN